MFNFFKESIKEFDHVVWPTNKETKNYFVSVSSIITVLAIVLFVIGTSFSTILFMAKDQINPIKITKSTLNSATASWASATSTKDVKIPTTTTTK